MSNHQLSTALHGLAEVLRLIETNSTEEAAALVWAVELVLEAARRLDLNHSRGIGAAVPGRVLL